MSRRQCRVTVMAPLVSAAFAQNRSMDMSERMVEELVTIIAELHGAQA